MGLKDIDPERFAALNRLLDRALELAPESRAQWLDALPEEHQALSAELRRLLQYAETDGPTPVGALPRLPSARPALCAGLQIGPYALRRSLGKGGMGEVWLAERVDGTLKRPVALKLPQTALLPQVLHERLAREREILATLDHPHIARIYDAGLTEGGQPYLALEYIEGAQIAHHTRELRARLELFLQVASAAAHAHNRLVIHRDIKPSNVIVTPQGHAKLIDFGIAKLLEAGRAEETELTAESGRAMSLAYASPEQIEGRALGVGTDVYSLGVVLFELLTDRRPFAEEEGARRTLEAAIIGRAPPKPSACAARWSRELQGDLDTIVLKALKKRPEERYLTVDALADDIKRHLNGMPVRARPDRTLYKLGKFVRRHRLAVTLSVVAVVATLSGAGAAVWQAKAAIAQREHAEEVKDFVVSLLKGASSWRAAQELTVRQMLMKGATDLEDRFLDRPALRAELLGLIGTRLSEFDDYATAERLIREGVQEAQRAEGISSPAALMLRLRLNNIYSVQGDTERLDKGLTSLLADLRRSPKAPPKIMDFALMNLAQLRIKQERYAEAVVVAREVVERSRARYGAQSTVTLNGEQLLAMALLEAGELEEAIQVGRGAFERLHQLEKPAPGAPLSPRTLSARSIYGRALLRANRTQAALAELEAAAADARRALSEKTPLVGVIAVDLAEGYLRQGDLKRARAWSEEAVEILQKHKKPGAPKLVRAEQVRDAVQRALDVLAEDVEVSPQPVRQ